MDNTTFVGLLLVGLILVQTVATASNTSGFYGNMNNALAELLDALNNNGLAFLYVAFAIAAQTPAQKNLVNAIAAFSWAFIIVRNEAIVGSSSQKWAIVAKNVFQQLAISSFFAVPYVNVISA